MAKKCPKCEECPAGEKWAVPFADFLSLLLALFIALYALASVNLEKQKALKEEFVKIYNFAEADSMEEQDKTEKSKADKPSEEDTEAGKAAAANETMGQITELEKQKAKGGNLEEVVEGTFMAIPAQLLFEQGKAELTKVRNSKYQDALELSTARANNVIRELIKYKISPNRLYSSGFGSSKAESLTDKRIVEFELRTMKETKTDDVDFDSIFEKMKK